MVSSGKGNIWETPGCFDILEFRLSSALIFEGSLIPSSVLSVSFASLSPAVSSKQRAGPGSTKLLFPGFIISDLALKRHRPPPPPLYKNKKAAALPPLWTLCFLHAAQKHFYFST